MFDLVVGTSTGGIIALGLGAGLSPGEILDFYVDGEGHGSSATRSGGGSSATRSWRSTGPSACSRRRCAGCSATTLLGESRVPLVVPSYNLGENAVYLFKTPHHERLQARLPACPMWAGGHGDHRSADVLPGLPPARRPCAPRRRRRLGQQPGDGRRDRGGQHVRPPLERSALLSIGTTTSARARPRRLDNAGLLRWIRGPNVVEVLLNGQSAGAFAQVQHLIGPDNARRLNPPAPDELAALDRCDARDLIAKAAHHSRVFCPEFEPCSAPTSPLRTSPFHGPNRKGKVLMLTH